MSKKTDRYRSYDMGDIMNNDLLDLFEAIDEEGEESSMTEIGTRMYAEGLKVGEDEQTQEQINLCLKIALDALAEGDFGFAFHVITSVQDGLLKRKAKKEKND